ncbi:MAG TPA: hypothetical protein EYM65_06665 [Dehalococcoidia bacterium]|nr:hypothetical protein [Dehalococcoidia bacterium]
MALELNSFQPARTCSTYSASSAVSSPLPKTFEVAAVALVGSGAGVWAGGTVGTGVDVGSGV